MMEKRLEGKTAVITGGAAGIGRAAVDLFCRHGASVFFVDIDRKEGEKTEKLVRSAGGEAAFICADVSRDEEVSGAVNYVINRCGRADILYNNASVFLPGKDGEVTEIEESIWDRILSVNLKSVYLFCKYTLPYMIKAGAGSIINTASSAAVIGIPGCDAYTAAKGATLAITRSMAVEYRPFGIRVNCIVPAGVQTGMMRQSNPADSDFDREHFLSVRTPSRRFGEPEEIAHAALFLASDESSYINGAALTADGGITICGDLSKPPGIR
jgi:NAD(P)-dependent dehydrogenase (short-subunit alcohol dehydrogenase family)